MPMDQAPEGAQGGGAITEMIGKVGGAIQMISQAIGQSKQAPPEAKQAAQALMQAFQELVQSLSGGEAQEDQGPQAQGQTAPMEAAGNKGAVPAM